MISLQYVTLTGIRANIKESTITLTASLELTDENMEKMRSLRPYLDAKSGSVMLVINPTQMQMNLSAVTMSVAERQAAGEVLEEAGNAGKG